MTTIKKCILTFFSLGRGFEGGQNPLYRRLPKRGFNNNAFRIEIAIVNLEQIAKLSESSVDSALLVSRGLVRKNGIPVKILGNGELKRAVTVTAHKFSAAAKEKIEKAGGQAVSVSS